MKKLLFIITKSEMGGAQRFLYELTTHLDVQKYDILVAAGGHGELLEKLAAAPKEGARSDSETRREPRPDSSGREKNIKTAKIRNFSNIFGIKNILAFAEIFGLIRKFKPDILYLLSSEAGFSGSIAGNFYRMLFWQGKPKIIYRIGGWAFKEPRNIIFKKLYLWAEKISAPFKDIIIVNSEFDRQLAIKNKIAKPEKIITIYNSLNVDELKFFSRDKARQFLFRQTHPTTESLIGTVANFYKNKGLEFLVLAAKKLKDEKIDRHFMIIGDGPERQKIEKLIQKNELENMFYLAGSIPDAYKYLKAFDLFVLPSVKEGQPWAILEAMAAEIPIVATNIAGIAEMIENEKSGLLVEPADSDALAAAIEKILTHPSLAQECVKNTSTIVKEKFGIEEMLRKNEELF
ncbi:MAG: glycosyltransferase [Parcubacteria group bacterium]|nr:glycosyltransferase [Parcubacteria group bacterium]